MTKTYSAVRQIRINLYPRIPDLIRLVRIKIIDPEYDGIHPVYGIYTVHGIHPDCGIRPGVI